MSDIEKRRNRTPVRKKSDEEQLLEITEELISSRPPLDFASYQREVGRLTPIWPIENPDHVMEKIQVLARNGMGTDRHTIAMQAALILRSIAELCDYIPMPMERLANVSLMDMPSQNRQLED